MIQGTDTSGKKASGDVQVHFLLCKSCGLCAEYCPQELMKPATEIPPDDRDGPVMNPSGHIVYEIHDPEGRCTGCGICATTCPEGAVVVYRRKGTPKKDPVGPPGEAGQTPGNGPAEAAESDGRHGSEMAGKEAGGG